MASISAKRPFWMHQLVEYLFGGLLIAQGLQSPTPVVPSVLGGLVMLNAACTKGPLAAFRLLQWPVHRIIDMVMISVIVLLAIQPWLDIESGARVVMVAVAAMLAFVWRGTDFTERTKRTSGRRTTAATPAATGTAPGTGTGGPTEPRRPGGLSATIGRTAGRAVGDGINAAKRYKQR